MKRLIVILVCILFALGGYVVAGELSYEDFKKLVTKDVAPDGFTLDESRVMNVRSMFHAEYKGDEQKAEMISISLYPGKVDFSEMDKLRKPEPYKYKDRPALYSDGNKAGIAVLTLILKNKAGKLSIHHRVFGGEFLDKAGLEKIAEKIGLENFEK